MKEELREAHRYKCLAISRREMWIKREDYARWMAEEWESEERTKLIHACFQQPLDDIAEVHRFMEVEKTNRTLITDADSMFRDLVHQILMLVQSSKSRSNEYWDSVAKLDAFLDPPLIVRRRKLRHRCAPHY